MRVAILGTGASAYAAALAISKSKDLTLEVDIYDYAMAFPEPNTQENSTLKNKVGNGLPVPVPSEYKTQSKLSGHLSGAHNFGGWAEFWGATILRYSENDLTSWPIKSKDLEEAWDMIEEEITFSQSSKETNPAPKRKVPLSVTSMLNKMNSQFASADKIAKVSTLAIAHLSDNPELGCNQCGHCLNGCPFNHIWKPSIGWTKFISDKRFTFHERSLVNRIWEVQNQVVVEYSPNQGLNKFETECYDKVFCGLGPIQTATLMVRSRISEDIYINDSQMILIPFWLKGSINKENDFKRISLSDAFLRKSLLLKNGNPFEIFVQIYAYSESLDEQISRRFYCFKIIPKKLRRIFLRNFAIGMTFLHETESGKINVSSKGDEQILTPIKRNSSKFQTILRLFKIFGNQKLRIIWPLIKFSNIGEGFHFGASFPMNTEKLKSNNYSDIFGRPNSLMNFHIVDASVFSQISPTPPTFNMMANSYRITKKVISE